jgi:hypothetical protein
VGDGRPYAHSSLLTTCQRGFVECAEEPSIRAPLAIVKQDDGDVPFSLNDAVDSVAKVFGTERGMIGKEVPLRRTIKRCLLFQVQNPAGHRDLLT